MVSLVSRFGAGASLLFAAACLHGADLLRFDFSSETKLRASAWDAGVLEPRIQNGGGLELSAMNISMGYRSPVLQASGILEKKPRPSGVPPADRGYFGFLVCPADEAPLLLGELRFSVTKGSYSRPRGFDIRTSADGFKASLLLVQDLLAKRPDLDEQRVDLASLGPLREPLEIRFYLHAPTASASLEFDDVVVSVSP